MRVSLCDDFNIVNNRQQLLSSTGRRHLNFSWLFTVPFPLSWLHLADSVRNTNISTNPAIINMLVVVADKTLSETVLQKNANHNYT